MKIKTLKHTIIVFILLFSFKLSGIDTALILLVGMLVINFQHVKIKIEVNISYLLFFLLFLVAYSGFILIIYGSGELIFFLKFFKTCILLLLLTLYFPIFSRRIDYQLFQKLIVYATLLHSLIIIFNILSPEFRDVIYSITGYSPRGPAWSRSPGITISFNSTAIIHLTALFILIFKNVFNNKIYKIIAIGIILISLIFLGRTMAFAGLSIIFIILLIKYTKIAVISFLIILLSISYIANLQNDIKNTNLEHILENYNHFISPIMSQDNSGAIYYDRVLKKHIYFSDNIYVLLFGDSYAGHIGILGGKGETDSDIGLINSINANGILITSLLYLMYILIIYLSRKKDIVLISYVVLLTVILTIKETGFLTSNATTLLFFLLLYQIDYQRKSI